MTPRIARAIVPFALVLSLAAGASGQGKSPGLPLEPPGSVEPQIPIEQQVDNQVTPLFAQPAAPRHVVDEAGCVIQTLVDPQPTRPVAFPGLAQFRPVARRCVATTFLFGAHPLLALAPVGPLLDMPCDHPAPVRECHLVLMEHHAHLQQPAPLSVAPNCCPEVSGTIALPTCSICQLFGNVTLSWQSKTCGDGSARRTITIGFVGACPCAQPAEKAGQPACLGQLIQAVSFVSAKVTDCPCASACKCADGKRCDTACKCDGDKETACKACKCKAANEGACTGCKCTTAKEAACKCAEGKRCDSACKCDGEKETACKACKCKAANEGACTGCKCGTGKEAACTGCKCATAKEAACKCADGKRCDSACKCDAGKGEPCPSCKCKGAKEAACECTDGKQCDPACKCSKGVKEGCDGCKCPQTGTYISPKSAPESPLFEELEAPEVDAEFIPWYDSYDAFHVKADAPVGSILRTSCTEVEYSSGKLRFSCQVELNGATYRVCYDGDGLRLKAE